jgi:hypothetical protein
MFGLPKDLSPRSFSVFMSEDNQMTRKDRTYLVPQLAVLSHDESKSTNRLQQKQITRQKSV